MSDALIFVGRWSDGVAVIDGAAIAHELAGRAVSWLTCDDSGAVLAIIDGREIHRRTSDGAWTVAVAIDAPLACCVAVGARLFVGTSDAQVLRVDGRDVEVLAGFARVPGRERWYAGSAIIDGKRVGPPLGVRTIAATCDGRVVLANVHVGGIPISLDGGETWSPTLDIDLDVHDVRAHPRDPDCVIAASAAGLCISRDAGRTWSVEARGLHAPYSASAGFVGDDLVIACATDHFAAQGALYHRPIAGDGPLVRLGRGLPEWTQGGVDSRCIAAHGATAAVVDRGQLYVSRDAGARWAVFGDFTGASGVVVAPR